MTNMIDIAVTSVGDVDGMVLRLPIVPRSGDHVVIKSKTYRVAKVLFTAESKVIRLYLEAA